MDGVEPAPRAYARARALDLHEGLLRNPVEELYARRLGRGLTAVERAELRLLVDAQMRLLLADEPGASLRWLRLRSP